MAHNVGSALFSGTGVQTSGGGTTANLSANNGAGTSVARIRITVGLLFLLAIVGLVLMHRAGFRFSVTVG